MTMQSRSREQAQLPRLAALLSLGAVVAALIAAVGSGMGLWHFRVGFAVLRYALYAAAAGGLLALVGIGLGLARRTGPGKLNMLALVVALLFSGYLLQLVATARSVPAIHDATTNLDDMPAFTTWSVRADNLEKVPADGRPELARLDPENRWKAIHREAYGDLRTLRVPTDVGNTTQRVADLARSRGWTVAKVDPNGGIVEATATSFFFRFKDDVVVRVRPDPQRSGGALVDMRSISRVGGSDVGMNAKRIRAFLTDLQAKAAG